MSDSENAIASIAALLSVSQPNTISNTPQSTEKALTSICVDCVLSQGKNPTINQSEAIDKLETMSDAMSQAPSLKNVDTSPIQSLIEALPHYIDSMSSIPQLSDTIHQHLLSQWSQDTKNPLTASLIQLDTDITYH